MFSSYACELCCAPPFLCLWLHFLHADVCPRDIWLAFCRCVWYVEGGGARGSPEHSWKFGKNRGRGAVVVRCLPGVEENPPSPFLFVLHIFFVVGVAGCVCVLLGGGEVSYFPAFFMFFEVGEFAVVDLVYSTLYISHFITPA
jgi:hypothetical protein